MEKHICRICRQGFSDGRSLEVHLWSHVVLSPSMKDEDKPLAGHDLRINPKKSQRFEIEWPETIKDKKRAKLEKDSSSLNASFGMTREELIHGDNDDDLRSRGTYEEKEMSGQPYSKLSMYSMPVKKKRRGSAPKVANASIFDFSFENCEEEVNAALSLMMLAREHANLIYDSNDKFSLTIGSGNKVHSFPCEDGDQQSKKLKVSFFASSSDYGDINPAVLKNEKRSLSIQCDSESGKQSSCNRKRYGCNICNKSFDSYQALGGHRTSHSKVRGEFKKLINQNHDSQTVKKLPKNFGNHVCNICAKNFPSGQALGGHKRSHSIAAAAVVVSSADNTAAHPHPTPMEVEPNSIDLNLPATDNDS
ncbi:zinc finger protein ZAT9-like [Phalaenopsis equestris]|uniref:zinc finger protein ZAT9-like n=1 Tax=Phalaenopsis equestris TaxID=78828 RepID=UPI0009E25847|nr:zinc finger protein ZAT9-like [Phalaenopsis equestris]